MGGWVREGGRECGSWLLQVKSSGGGSSGEASRAGPSPLPPPLHQGAHLRGPLGSAADRTGATTSAAASSSAASVSHVASCCPGPGLQRDCRWRREGGGCTDVWHVAVSCTCGLLHFVNLCCCHCRQDHSLLVPPPLSPPPGPLLELKAGTNQLRALPELPSIASKQAVQGSPERL